MGAVGPNKQRNKQTYSDKGVIQARNTFSEK